LRHAAGTTATGNGAPSFGSAQSWATRPAGTVIGCSIFTVSCRPWRRELASTEGGPPGVALSRPT
jgi:hypothetical protein